MVGMPGLEPGNPEGADLQSAAVAAVPHPHSVIKNSLGNNIPCKRFEILRLVQILVNVYPVSGRIHSLFSAHPQLRPCVFNAVESPSALCNQNWPRDFVSGPKNNFWSRQRESNPQPTVYKTVALPLSHAGGSVEYSRYRPRALAAKKLPELFSLLRRQPVLQRHALALPCGVLALVLVGQDVNIVDEDVARDLGHRDAAHRGPNGRV